MPGGPGPLRQPRDLSGDAGSLALRALPQPVESFQEETSAAEFVLAKDRPVESRRLGEFDSAVEEVGALERVDPRRQFVEGRRGGHDAVRLAEEISV